MNKALETMAITKFTRFLLEVAEAASSKEKETTRELPPVDQGCISIEAVLMSPHPCWGALGTSKSPMLLFINPISSLVPQATLGVRDSFFCLALVHSLGEQNCVHMLFWILKQQTITVYESSNYSLPVLILKITHFPVLISLGNGWK